MEPLEPLATDARELLATYRRERPGVQSRARNWPGVRARIEPSPRSAAPGRSPLWFGVLALVLAAAVLLLVHALFVAWQATHVARAPLPAAGDALSEPVVAPATTHPPTMPPSVHPPTAVPAASPPIEPAPLQRPRTVVPARPTDAPREDTAPREVELVASARSSLADGDWTAALGQLDEHARRFPAGVLAEERSALRAIALCRSRAADARTAQLEFNSRFPGSHHHRSIRAACETRTDSRSP